MASSQPALQTMRITFSQYYTIVETSINRACHLLPEVLQDIFTTASEVGLQEDSVPLLVVLGLSDFTPQEPEEKMTDTLTLQKKNKRCCLT